MAIINCPECNREISDQCNSCPGCGYVIRTQKRQNTLKFTERQKTLVAIAGVLLLIVVSVILLNSNGVFLSKNEKYALTAVKVIQETLLMPESIRVYDSVVYVIPDKPADDSSTLEAKVLIYYGAQNKGGGITDETVVVFVAKESTVFYEDGTSSSTSESTANMTEMERLVHEMVLSWNCLTYEKNKVEISQLGVSVNAEKIQNILK